MYFDSKYYINHLLPQYEYINNTNLDVHILHMEKINDDFKKIFPKLCQKEY